MKQLLLVFLLNVGFLHAYPNGAPEEACISMYPKHNRFLAQTGDPPFELTVDMDTYSFSRNVSVKVTLKALQGKVFRGFLLQARSLSASDTRNDLVGVWSTLGPAKSVCHDPNTGSFGLTQISSTEKTNIQFIWNPPAKRNVGHVVFKAAVVISESVFYVGVTSSMVLEVNTPALTTETSLFDRPGSGIGSALSVPNVKGCGKSKGCFRDPKGCDGKCTAIVTWDISARDSDSVLLSLAAPTDGYVALALSEDESFISLDDHVFVCYDDKQSRKVNVTYAKEQDGKLLPLPSMSEGLHLIGGAVKSGILYCHFSATDSSDKQNTGSVSFRRPWFVKVLYGDIDDNGMMLPPTSSSGSGSVRSPKKIHFREETNVDGGARFPMIKAHGCLMILSWILCVSIAVILARYYKGMWPRQHSTEKWFLAHQVLMSFAIILTSIAVILIFVHVGGYSQMKGLPAEAHPILGIIATCFMFLNPLIALCRCDPDSKHRPIFNWCHWLFGTCAHCISIPTIFIGMNLMTAYVPWWLTWILFVWCIFHLVVEIVLEIHGCCVRKENRKRLEEYEMAHWNVEYTKVDGSRRLLPPCRPAPAGARFKCIMLSVYCVVTVIVALVLVIVIAVV